MKYLSIVLLLLVIGCSEDHFEMTGKVTGLYVTNTAINYHVEINHSYTYKVYFDDIKDLHIGDIVKWKTNDSYDQDKGHITIIKRASEK